MGRIKSKTRLVIEQFPEQKEWIGKLFLVINEFITDVISSINGNLLFGENVSGQEHELEFTYVNDATTFPQAFRWKLSKPPKALVVCAATEQDFPASASEIIFLCSWIYRDDGHIAITRGSRITAAHAVDNLEAGYRYRIRVRVSP